jgi:DNA-binding CsgD family transcriptional regulator
MKKIHASIIEKGPLTSKEAAVLRYLCEGYLQKQIALKLFRSHSTVGKHLESISRKLDCHCAAEIVSTSVAMGLVKVEIREQQTGVITKVLLIFLMMNMLFIQTDGRRPPRPIRTVRITRTIRTNRES